MRSAQVVKSLKNTGFHQLLHNKFPGQGKDFSHHCKEVLENVTDMWTPRATIARSLPNQSTN